MAKWKTGRVDRMRVKESKDPYELTEKLPGGATCRECSAVVQEGRWVWSGPARGDVLTVCPACRRTMDDYPAGYLMLEGPFFEENRKEIMNLVRNVGAAEKGEHPLERVMAVRRQGKATLITTTGIHLARRLGNSLKRSYQGDLQVQYEEGARQVRINWTR